MPFLTSEATGLCIALELAGANTTQSTPLVTRSSKILFCSSTLSALAGEYGRIFTPIFCPAFAAAIRWDSHTGTACDFTTIAMLYFLSAFTSGLKLQTGLSGFEPFIVTFLGLASVGEPERAWLAANHVTIVKAITSGTSLFVIVVSSNEFLPTRTVRPTVNTLQQHLLSQRWIMASGSLPKALIGKHGTDNQESHYEGLPDSRNRQDIHPIMDDSHDQRRHERPNEVALTPSQTRPAHDDDSHHW